MRQAARPLVRKPRRAGVASPTQGFFRKSAVIGVAEIFGRLPLIFTAGYVAKSLGPATYGSWALVLAYQGLLISVVSLGLPTSLSRLASVATAARARGLFTLSLQLTSAVMILLAIVSFLARFPLADVVGLQHALAWLLAIGCVVAVTTGFEGLLGAYLKSRELAGRYAVSVVARSCIEVTAIYLVFAGVVHVGHLHGAKLLLLYAAFVTVLKLVIYPLFVIVGSVRGERPSREERSVFLRYGLPMIPAGIVVFLTAQGDRLVLGHLFDKDQLGLYAFGAAVSGYMTYVGYAINPLLLPRASALHDAGDDASVRALFVQSQNVSMALYASGVAMFILFSHEIIRITAGPAYYRTANVMVLLAAAVGLEAVVGIFQWVFHLVRKPRYVLWFNLGYMLLNVGLVVAGALVGGATTVAAFVLVSVVVANIARYVVARRLLVIDLAKATAVGLVALAAVSPALAASRDLSFAVRVLIFALLVAAFGVPAYRSVRRTSAA